MLHQLFRAYYNVILCEEYMGVHQAPVPSWEMSAWSSLGALTGQAEHAQKNLSLLQEVEAEEAEEGEDDEPVKPLTTFQICRNVRHHARAYVLVADCLSSCVRHHARAYVLLLTVFLPALVVNALETLTTTLTVFLPALVVKASETLKYSVSLCGSNTGMLQTLLQAIMVIVLGAALVAFFADPMVDAVNGFSE